MLTLKLVIYKKKACVYLVGGTKEGVITLPKDESIFEFCKILKFDLNRYFWDGYKGIFHKGKFYEASDAMETAIVIKKILMEK